MRARPGRGRAVGSLWTEVDLRVRDVLRTGREVRVMAVPLSGSSDGAPQVLVGRRGIGENLDDPALFLYKT